MKGGGEARAFEAPEPFCLKITASDEGAVKKMLIRRQGI